MDLGIHQRYTISSKLLKGPASIVLPWGGDAYWFLVIIIITNSATRAGQLVILKFIFSVYQWCNLNKIVVKLEAVCLSSHYLQLVTVQHISEITIKLSYNYCSRQKLVSYSCHKLRSKWVTVSRFSVSALISNIDMLRCFVLTGDGRLRWMMHGMRWSRCC